MRNTSRATPKTTTRLFLMALICLIASLGIACKHDRFRAVWAMGFQGDYTGIIEFYRIAGETAIVMHSAAEPKRTIETRDSWLQDECIDVLEAFATDEAVEALLTIVEQSAAIDDSSFNAIPVQAAIRTQKPFVLERLLEFCKNDSAPLRYAGAAGLGFWDFERDDRALDQLCKMVRDSEYMVRSCALKSLGLIGKSHIDAADQALSCILSCATESNVSVRGSVAEALGSLGIPDTFEIVEQMLRNLSNQFREPAIVALGAFDEDRALPYLKEFARSKMWTQRVTAVEALTKFNSQKAADILMDMVDDSSHEVREALAREVKPIDPFIDGVLLKLLQDPSPNVRSLAIVTLGETRPKEAREAAFAMMTDPDPKVRREGVEALNDQLFKRDELRQLLSAAATDRDYHPRIAVARRLKDVPIEGGEQILIKLANDRDL